MNIKHILVIFAGAALPVLFTVLQGAPILTLAVLAKAATSAGLVGIAAAMQSFLPKSAS